ncbi:hypothetical protein ONZ45_g10011 [Pleurotus djamor]|nr:hypothetical protein ONZ45_g10011 [Pleurotus djamor]
MPKTLPFQLKGYRNLSILACFTLSLFALGAFVHRRGTFNDILKFHPQTRFETFSIYSLWPTTASPPKAHIYRQDGLLEAGTTGKHPVLELIQKAEKEWKEKQKRASRSLSQAVAEYERRYKRLPPKGFDAWWKYVQDNDVQLPDEYDMIWKDIEHFWGINPKALRKIQAIQERIPDAFTMGRDANGTISIVKLATSQTHPMPWDSLTRGYDEIMDLLKPVAHDLPEFRLTISPHDNPNLVTDYEVKQAALDAAASGRYVDYSKPPRMPRLGFISACPPDSPARRSGLIVDQRKRPPPRMDKTFIYDHRTSMDPCQNPYLFYYHSQFLPYPPRAPSAQPVLSAQLTYCSTMVHHNIQPPSFISWQADVTPRANDPPWENKTDDRIFWRGSNTGMIFSDETPWRYSQRPRLVHLANDMEGTITIKVPNDGTSNKPYHDVEVDRKRLNSLLFDIHFAGAPIACETHYCDYLRSEFQWYPKQNPNDPIVGAHKYKIDVDGNGWSSRFKRLITTNSLVFKATIYPEWWLDRIQPWVHYVPIQADYSDLHDVFVFFRGGLYGEGAHDDLAKKIAYAGREWSKAYWRKEDMTAYFFRLILEYSRVMSLDREAMTYKLP